MSKIKIKESVLRSMIAEAAKKVIKEDYYDGFSDAQQSDAEQSYINKGHGDDSYIEDGNSDLEFKPNGSYTVSNSGGYEIMLSDDGEMARVRDAFGGENPEISDWLPIEYVDGEEMGEDGYPETELVIDPNGYNIPLNQVMRIRESKKIKTSVKQLTETIKKAIKEEKLRSVIKSKISEAKDNNWIAGVTKNKGGLHKKLGIPEGDKIPQSLINSKIKEIKGKYKDGEKMSAADEKFLKELDLAKTLKKVNESTDQDRYEDVLFLQGEEADEALGILENEGEDAAMNYLMQWHDLGNHMGMDDLGNGSSDQTYERDGYTMAWNTRLGYIGLAYDLSYNHGGVQESKKLKEWRSRDSNADAWADLETNGAASQQRQKMKDLYAKKREAGIQDNSHVPEYYSTYENGYIANINGYTQNQIDAMNDESRNSIYNNIDNFDESKKSSQKHQIKEGVSRNIPKIEKYVNQINALIAQAVDSDGDKIGVIEPNSTYEIEWAYNPIIYQNGALKIVSYPVHRPKEIHVDVIRSRDMEFDGIPTLQLISRMFKKAVKNKDKYSNVDPDMNY